MTVKRIVSNVSTSDLAKADAFYKEMLGLEVLMDMGWIRTYGSRARRSRICPLKSTMWKRLW